MKYSCRFNKFKLNFYKNITLKLRSVFIRMGLSILINPLFFALWERIQREGERRQIVQMFKTQKARFQTGITTAQINMWRQSQFPSLKGLPRVNKAVRTSGRAQTKYKLSAEARLGVSAAREEVKSQVGTFFIKCNNYKIRIHFTLNY